MTRILVLSTAAAGGLLLLLAGVWGGARSATRREMGRTDPGERASGMAPGAGVPAPIPPDVPTSTDVRFRSLEGTYLISFTGSGGGVTSDGTNQFQCKGEVRVEIPPGEDLLALFGHPQTVGLEIVSYEATVSVRGRQEEIRVGSLRPWEISPTSRQEQAALSSCLGVWYLGVLRALVALEDARALEGGADRYREAVGRAASWGRTSEAQVESVRFRAEPVQRKDVDSHVGFVLQTTWTGRRGDALFRFSSTDRLAVDPQTGELLRNSREVVRETVNTADGGAGPVGQQWEIQIEPLRELTETPRSVWDRAGPAIAPSSLEDPNELEDWVGLLLQASSVAIWCRSDPAALRDVLEAARADSDAGRRGLAVLALVLSQGPPQPPEVSQLLLDIASSDRSILVRELAVFALGLSGESRDALPRRLNEMLGFERWAATSAYLDEAGRYELALRFEDLLPLRPVPGPDVRDDVIDIAAEQGAGLSVGEAAVAVAVSALSLPGTCARLERVLEEPLLAPALGRNLGAELVLLDPQHRDAPAILSLASRFVERFPGYSDEIISGLIGSTIPDDTKEPFLAGWAADTRLSDEDRELAGVGLMRLDTERAVRRFEAALRGPDLQRVWSAVALGGKLNGTYGDAFRRHLLDLLEREDVLPVLRFTAAQRIVQAPSRDDPREYPLVRRTFEEILRVGADIDLAELGEAHPELVDPVLEAIQRGPAAMEDLERRYSSRE